MPLAPRVGTKVTSLQDWGSDMAKIAIQGGARVTAYTMTGPTAGTVGVNSTAFTVTLGAGKLTGSVTITPADGGASGTFAPTSVNLTNTARSATFTYDAAGTGTKTISVTNTKNLTNPGTIAYVASAAVSPVTAYTMTGPTTGLVGVASSIFRVTLGTGTLSGLVVVTPDDSSAGGTFTPPAVNLTNTARTATFTYTSSAAATDTISVTNNSTLVDPSPISYVASAVAVPATTYTLTGPSSGVVGSPSANFTVHLASGTLAGTATVTPNDGGNGGTFMPPSVGLTFASPLAIFTYTAASSGLHLIATTNNAGLSNPSPLSYTSASIGGHPYYVAPIATHGTGTFLDPWGIPDLYNPVTFAVGPAMTTPVAGDTVYFRDGDYQVNTQPTNAFQRVLLFLTHSGVAGNPITLSKYPGETPVFHLNSGMASLFGTSLGQNSIGDLNYIRYLGLTIIITATFDNPATPGFTNSPRAFSMGGNNNEIGWCSITGCDVTTGDNHEGIFFSGGFNGTDNWVHDNEISGFTSAGNSHNSSGIKVYSGKVLLVEHNYVHDNTCGIYDKAAPGTTGSPPDGTHSTTYRENYVINNNLVGWLGTNQGSQAAYLVYDNVIGNTIQVSGYQTGSQFYNNLLLYLGTGPGPTVHGYIGFQGLDPQFYKGLLWNNVLNCNAISGPAQTQVAAFYSGFNTFTVGQPTSPILYMDYNVYTAASWYVFIGLEMNLATMQGQGFEINSTQVADLLAVYNDLTNYVLKTAYRTAGRYGDPVGPRVPIGPTGGIMDLSLYGPGAMP